MKRVFFSAFLLLAGSAVACNNDTPANDMGSPDLTAPSPDLTTPPTLVPVLGSLQIDRMARAGVNTALTAPFDPDAQTREVLRAQYNQDSDILKWRDNWVPSMLRNLKILDVLDSATNPGDGCGNQFAYSAAMGYTPLATVLADDQLYVESSLGTCNQYLAVEAGVATDCGGRSPLSTATSKYDTIDVTYSALAIGALSGVTDGVAQPTPGPDLATFPYLRAAP